MKVNITGRGIIPGINSLAPRYGVELSEKEIARLINYQQFKVFSSETGLIITKRNINDVFKPVKPVQKKEEIEVPKVVTEQIIEKPAEPVVVEIKEPEFETSEIIEEEKPSPVFLEVTELSNETEVTEDGEIVEEEETTEESETSLTNENEEEKKTSYHNYYKNKKKRK